MSDTASYTPSASTIPPWPSSCTNVTNVYRNCSKLTKSWTTSSESLMPISITNHSGAVSGTPYSLASLFDSDWGGVSNIFNTVKFFTASGDLIPDTESWSNNQRIKTGFSATIPASVIASYNEPFSDDLYTSGWNHVSESPFPYENVTTDINASLTYDRKTHTYAFYDLYVSSEVPIKSGIVNRRESVDIPTIQIRQNVSTVGWTLSSGRTAETSGDIISEDSEFFTSVSQNFNVYSHYNAAIMLVSSYYYNNNELTCTVNEVEYGKTVTPPTVGEKTGYTFAGWYVGSSQITDFTKYAITNNTALSAHYNINNYTIHFVSGYPQDCGYESTTRLLTYKSSLSDSDFPEPMESLEDYVQHYGWDKSDRTKFENITSTSTISSLYRVGYMNDATIPSYLSSYQMNGYLSDGNVTSVTVNIPDEKSSLYSASNFSFLGSAFSFDFNRSETAPVTANETFSVTVGDELGLSYTILFDITVTNNKISLNYNNKSWYKCFEKWSSGESPYMVDILNQPMEKLMESPNENKYYGVFQSCSAWHKNDTYSRTRVNFGGMEEFGFYLKYCGESCWFDETSQQWNGDFVCVGKLNESLSAKPNIGDSNIFDVVSSAELSGDDGIEFYKKITFGNLNTDDNYFVDIAYVKDKTNYTSLDRAYLLFDIPTYSGQKCISVKDEIIVD